jgi:hypothetical protein
VAVTDFVYAKARAALGQGQINLLTANVEAMLVSAAYVPSPSSDQYVSTIVNSGGIVFRDYALTGKAFSISGGFQGNVPLLASIASATIITAIVLYINTGVDSTSPLLYYSAGGTGFPFLAAGFDYAISYDQSAGGWFQA